MSKYYKLKLTMPDDTTRTLTHKDLTVLAQELSSVMLYQYQMHQEKETFISLNQLGQYAHDTKNVLFHIPGDHIPLDPRLITRYINEEMQKAI